MHYPNSRRCNHEIKSPLLLGIFLPIFLFFFFFFFYQTNIRSRAVNMALKFQICINVDILYGATRHIRCSERESFIDRTKTGRNNGTMNVLLTCLFCIVDSRGYRVGMIGAWIDFRFSRLRNLRVTPISSQQTFRETFANSSQLGWNLRTKARCMYSQLSTERSFRTQIGFSIIAAIIYIVRIQKSQNYNDAHRS